MANRTEGKEGVARLYTLGRDLTISNSKLIKRVARTSLPDLRMEVPPSERCSLPSQAPSHHIQSSTQPTFPQHISGPSQLRRLMGRQIEDEKG
jgi:hypothetical protein